MTINRTRERARNQNELVERTRDRIIMEHKDSSNHSHQSRKPPGMEREVYEMRKARAPAGTEMCSQECKMQGMPQNRTLPQGMPIQEKNQES